MNKQPVSKEICQHTFCIKCVNTFEQKTGEEIFQITPAQYKIVEYLVKDLSNKEIADKLDLTSGTISNQLAKVTQLTGMRRTGLAILLITGRMQKKVFKEKQIG